MDDYTHLACFDQYALVKHMLRPFTNSRDVVRRYYDDNRQKIKAIKYVRETSEFHFGKTCSLLVAKNVVEALWDEWDADKRERTAKIETIQGALDSFRLTWDEAEKILDALTK